MTDFDEPQENVPPTPEQPATSDVAVERGSVVTPSLTAREIGDEQGVLVRRTNAAAIGPAGDTEVERHRSTSLRQLW